MALQNGTILVGATNSSTGGTSKTLSADGVQVQGGVHLIDASNTDVTTRLAITAKSKPGQLDAVTGEWSMDKRSLTVTIPKVVNGKQKFPSVYITIQVHPLMTQAEIDALCYTAAQCLFRADFDNFRRVGSIA